MRDDYRNQSGYFSPTENAVVHHWESSNGFSLEEPEKKPKRFNTAEYLDRVKSFTDGQLIDEQIALKETVRRCGAWITAASHDVKQRQSLEFTKYSLEHSKAKSKLRIIHEVAVARDRQNSNKRQKMKIKAMCRKLHELMGDEAYTAFISELRKIVDAECGESVQSQSNRRMNDGE